MEDVRDQLKLIDIMLATREPEENIDLEEEEVKPKKKRKKTLEQIFIIPRNIKDGKKK
jgi:hypothetical protein